MSWAAGFIVTPFRLCSKRLRRRREYTDTERGFKETAMWALKNQLDFIIYLEVKHLREEKVSRPNNLQCMHSR